MGLIINQMTLDDTPNLRERRRAAQPRAGGDRPRGGADRPRAVRDTCRVREATRVSGDAKREREMCQRERERVSKHTGNTKVKTMYECFHTSIVNNKRSHAMEIC